jgi:hypothetical protein
LKAVEYLNVALKMGFDISVVVADDSYNAILSIDKGTSREGYQPLLGI